MNTVKKTHRLLAIFLIVTVLLPSVTPYSTIRANNSGPNAPEAASFEPVDATDMVNLLTGDFSYVLPLMNVPSPEGGYPIALAYHGGIAMDLQSSWVGLGWNLNPGAINRSVNGYPDDYSSTQLTDYFYDSGGTEVSYGVSLGYIAPNGFSVGVGYNWGSNQSSSGFVSVGIGPVQQTIGVNQPSSIGIGVPLGDVLSLGVSVSSNGKTSASIGARFDSNGTGFSIGASTDGTYSAGISKHNDQTGRGYSLGTTFSSEGVGLTVGLSRDYPGQTNPISDSIGIGSHTAFNTTAKQGDYTINQSGFTIPIIIPTPIGIFNFSFGKKKVVYFSAKKTSTLITGPLNFGSAFNSKRYFRVKCTTNGPRGSKKKSTKSFSTLEEAQNYKNNRVLVSRCVLDTIITDEAFMDIYEVPLSQETSKYARDYNITYNNPVFPAYDKYEVQGQGLSGSIHATLVDNGRLYGLSKETEDKDEVAYEFDGLYDEQGELPDDMDFRPRPEFYFDNEITSYLAAPKATFDPINTAITKGAIADIFKNLNGNELETNRFKKSNYIEYATNEELIDNDPKDLGFLAPETPLDRSQLPKDGIGAYKVTAADGKTYHYSLPVYNHETITRTYGIVNERPQESKSYLEKRQLEPYATHWLLTAVTGPDYIDNGDGIANEGDLGYWVNFDYGLWSDAFVWSPHPEKAYIEDKGDNKIKTWVKGRKQVYYLDKINTRTHTAVFIKSVNTEGRSLAWEYRSVPHDGARQKPMYFSTRFKIPNHPGLKLDRVLLLKNEDLTIKKDQGENTIKYGNVLFKNSNKPVQAASYYRSHSVYNTDFKIPSIKRIVTGPNGAGVDTYVMVDVLGDQWQELRSKALKEVVFEQDYSLSDEQLSLRSVTFNGKQSTSVLPPYRFSYIEDANYEFNKEDANDWGYYANNPALWSLNEITTPQGGKIEINYEPHNFRTVKSQEYVFKNTDFKIKNRYVFEVDNRFHFNIGKIFKMNTLFYLNYVKRPPLGYQTGLIQADFDRIKYDGDVILEKVTTVGDKKRLTVKLLEELTIDKLKYQTFPEAAEDTFKSNSQSYNLLVLNTASNDFYTSSAGVRVASISTTDGIQNYSSEYTYGENEDGVGWITYSPHAPNAQRDVPYSTELPPSRPMYEYVTHTTTDVNGESTGKVVYQFNVLNQGDKDRIKYGNFYELQTKREDSKTSGNKEISINAYEIHDNLSSIGQLLSVSTYNKEDQLLTKLTNTYCQPEDLPENMGIVQESYQSYKKITKNKGSNNERYQWMVNSSTRVRYPSLLKSSTELKNGVRYTTTFSDFDMISGQAKQTHSTSSLGLEMKTESEPAFYHYPEMGSKVDNASNKNMLSQSSQNLSYFRKKPTDPWQLYDAQVDTWKGFEHSAKSPANPSQSFKDKIWRKFQTYVWNGDINSNGSYKNFTPFNWNNTSLNSESWRKTSEILRYSNYSNILETQDINGNKASKKLGDDESKIMVVCDAPYDAMVYANFEYEEDFEDLSKTGGIMLIPGSTIVSTKAHTGSYSLKTPANSSIAFSGRVKGSGQYKASIWVDKNNYEGTKLFITKGSNHVSYNPQEIVEAGDWVQLNFNFEITEESLVSVQFPSGQTYFDDFRIHPVSSTMVTYVYNEWDELTYILGANNMATKYEYDAAGKLHKTYTEVAKNESTNGGFKLINKTNYNYKNQ